MTQRWPRYMGTGGDGGLTGLLLNGVNIALLSRKRYEQKMKITKKMHATKMALSCDTNKAPCVLSLLRQQQPVFTSQTSNELFSKHGTALSYEAADSNSCTELLFFLNHILSNQNIEDVLGQKDSSL